MLAETPVTQRSPCYSAVSSSLTNPLPDCFNYSPFATLTISLRINASLVSSGQTLYQAALHCCSALLQNVVGNSGETQCLEEAEQQAEASVNVPYPPLQIVNSVPFCHILSISICSLSQSSLFFLSTIPSFSSDQFFVLLR